MDEFCANWSHEDNNKSTSRMRPAFLELVRERNKDAALLFTLSYLNAFIEWDGNFEVTDYTY